MLSTCSKRFTLLAAAAGSVLVAGCGSDSLPTSAQTEQKPSFNVGDNVTATPAPQAGKIKICKVGNVAGTFSVTAASSGGGTATTLNPANITTGTCIDVAEDADGAGAGSNITITETSAGFESATVLRLGTGAVPQPFTNGGTLFLNSFHGYTLTFTNHGSPNPHHPTHEPPGHTTSHHGD